jgi:hypothetical protein
MIIKGPANSDVGKFIHYTANCIPGAGTEVETYLMLELGAKVSVLGKNSPFPNYS